MAMTASKSARGERRIGRRAADEVEELMLVVFATGALSHHLLRQDVERRYRAATMASSSPRRTDAHERRAFDQIVTGHREQPPLRHAGDGVARAADPLQQRGDTVR